MAVFWRQADLSCIQYSQICGQVVRADLKPQYQAEAKKAADVNVKVNKLKET
ncbi:ATP synthase subunit epsilon-like protein, mitochondrial [Carcharodon carcharias]|uniref:ATP synthase subunit epsilon-like protein, mitochondrial n=1 Tax=Carcharodon carcharias TaxID=13397 RepID=UPI001B7E7E98|nr:ATP synthase subunit epsilon-like protein, mitochondrial [Carcharodon carcharias]